MKKVFTLSVFILLLLNTKAQNCPTITVNAPTARLSTNTTFSITANVKGVEQNASITYNWSISSGTISSGQGTSSITIDAGAEPGYCTATVEIGGLSPNCTSMASASVEITEGPQKIMSVAFTTVKALNDSIKKFIVKTELDKLLIAQTAAIKITAVNQQQFATIKTSIEKTFAANYILPLQFTITNAGIAKIPMVDMWIKKD